VEIDENIQIFISEGEELLQDMEDALLELEASDNDDEVLGKIFRAAHTIKGSAGLFGFDHIIHFTHIVENVLDDMRNCLIPTSSELITVLMRSRDYMSSLLAGLSEDFEGDKSEEAELKQLLTAFKTGVTDPATCAPAQPDTAKPLAQDQLQQSDTDSTETEHYHISLRLGADTFHVSSVSGFRRG